jgi:hypothetical protein
MKAIDLLDGIRARRQMRTMENFKSERVKDVVVYRSAPKHWPLVQMR